MDNYLSKIEEKVEAPNTLQNAILQTVTYYISKYIRVEIIDTMVEIDDVSFIIAKIFRTKLQK